MNFRLGELFCGAGGIALGAAQAMFWHEGEQFGVSHEWATDYDRDSCATYQHNIAGEEGIVIHEDVRKLDIAQLSPIDALAFGFPCNDFSVVGEQKGIEGEYGPLYRYGIKGLAHFQPLWFLAENVGGLRNANQGLTFQLILQNLQKVGYRIYPHLYKFEEYGIPQARHRIIIVGIREDIPVEFKIPSAKALRVSAKKALEEPPIPKDAFNHERTRQSETVIERLKHIEPGENAFTANLPDHLKLRVKGAKISQIYKRLHPEKPSYSPIQ